MKIMIIGALPNSLINFRGDLITDLINDGFEVLAMAHNANSEERDKIKKLGAHYINLPVVRNGLNPLSDLKTLYSIIKNLRIEKPDYVLAYTIKPVIWGGIASKFFPKTKFIGMITGLGFAFGDGGFVRFIIRKIVIRLYKLSLSESKAVIFQNPDNKKQLEQLNILPKNNIYVVNGSGVNLKKYAYQELEQNIPQLTFLMVARLLKDKGIFEFISAAKRVKGLHDNVNFILVGPKDNGPNAINFDQVLDFHKKGFISYQGAVSDVRPLICDASVYVLPSYHEGMPRTILEAMAIGRPIITTDVPGCRETVLDDVNGWLVPMKNIEQLTEKIIWFIEHPGRICMMGESSRKLAVKNFNVDSVNRKIIDIIKK